MGKRDRRLSLKMKRRKAQVKKKGRDATKKPVARPEAAPPAKKTRTPKAAAAAPATSA
jgi:hypothetical protein